MKHLELHNHDFIKLLNDFEQAIKDEQPERDMNAEHVSHVRELLYIMERKGLNSIKELDQQVVNDFITYLENRPNQRRSGLLSDTTINKFLASIYNLLKYLHTEGVKMAVLRLRYKPRGERKLPTVLTPEEIQQLFSVTDDTAIGVRDKCMIALYFGCGLRRSEGINLLLTDIDFHKSRILIRKTKNNRERYVLMSPNTQKMIEDYVYSARDMYMPEDAPHEELFINERGQPAQGQTLAKRMEALWGRVKDRYGSEKHVTLHSLRHSLGTELYKSGMKLPMISLMLGHRSTEATELYVTLTNLNQ